MTGRRRRALEPISSMPRDRRPPRRRWSARPASPSRRRPRPGAVRRQPDPRGSRLRRHHDDHVPVRAVCRAPSIVTMRSATILRGKGAMTNSGMSSPALISRARPAPSSTTESVVRSTVGDAHGPVAPEPHARHRADQDRAGEREVDVPGDDVREAGGPEQDRGVEHVRADHALGLRRKIRMSAIAISAPLPAEVTPSTKPTHTRAPRPRPCAAVPWGSCRAHARACS